MTSSELGKNLLTIGDQSSYQYSSTDSIDSIAVTVKNDSNLGAKSEPKSAASAHVPFSGWRKRHSHGIRVATMCALAIVAATAYIVSVASTSDSLGMETMFRAASVCAATSYAVCVVYQAYYCWRDTLSTTKQDMSVWWARGCILVLCAARTGEFSMSAFQSSGDCDAAFSNAQGWFSVIGYCLTVLLYYLLARIFFKLHSVAREADNDDEASLLPVTSAGTAIVFSCVATVVPSAIIPDEWKAILLAASLAFALAMCFLLALRCYDAWHLARTCAGTHPSAADFGSVAVYTMAAATIGMLIHLGFDAAQLLSYGSKSIGQVVCDSRGADRFMEVAFHTLAQVAMIVTPAISLCASNRLLASSPSPSQQQKDQSTRIQDMVYYLALSTSIVVLVVLVPYGVNRVNTLDVGLQTFTWSTDWTAGLSSFGLVNSTTTEMSEGFFDPQNTDVQMSWLQASVVRRWGFICRAPRGRLHDRGLSLHPDAHPPRHLHPTLLLVLRGHVYDARPKRGHALECSHLHVCVGDRPHVGSPGGRGCAGARRMDAPQGLLQSPVARGVRPRHNGRAHDCVSHGRRVRREQDERPEARVSRSV